MTPDDKAREAEHARIAVAIRDEMATRVLTVLQHYQQHLAAMTTVDLEVQPDGTPVPLHRPVFLRYVTVTALVEVLGTLLKDAMEDDATKAQPWIVQTLARLDAFVWQRPPQRLN